GIVALGTNGEAALLDDDEGDLVVETVRKDVPADRTLIVGAGRESTRATIAAARRAAAGGADAVLVRTPSFYRGHVPLSALVAHYTAVADSSAVPVLLYNYAAFTGVNMAPETIARLAAHPNIAGLKETSTDGAQFVELAAVVPARFAVLAGSAPGAYTAFCAGAAGAILAVACVRPALCLRLRALVLEGRHADALAIQQRLTPLARAVTTGFGIAGLKAAMDLSGLEGGDPRPPLGPLSSDAVERIRTLLNDTAD
ncbi:MAG TPA: dihydrodipicolinate synthase family protein, partial [Vicinamibacterales bacterium]